MTPTQKKEAHTHHAQLPAAPKPKVTNKKPVIKELGIKSERDIALDFAALVHKKFDTLIKATVLFGSQAKNTAKPGSDIDIIIIVDDASVDWDLELLAWYREELGKLVAQQARVHELHINTIKLTTWWQDLMQGDPVVLNIIRSGEALIDIAGFFKPLKSLLLQGRIHSTPEAVYTALQRAPSHLSRSRFSEMSAVEGVYWCMVDAAQAALITAGQLPPSPEHIPQLLKESFVDKGYIKIDLIHWYRELYALHKGIIHGQITQIKGADIDLWQQRAEFFMKKMTELIDSLISQK